MKIVYNNIDQTLPLILNQLKANIISSRFLVSVDNRILLEQDYQKIPSNHMSEDELSAKVFVLDEPLLRLWSAFII